MTDDELDEIREHNATDLGRRFAKAMGWGTSEHTKSFLYPVSLGANEIRACDWLATFPGMEVVLGELDRLGLGIAISKQYEGYIWKCVLSCPPIATYEAVDTYLHLAVLAAAVEAVEKRPVIKET